VSHWTSLKYKYYYRYQREMDVEIKHGLDSQFGNRDHVNPYLFHFLICDNSKSSFLWLYVSSSILGICLRLVARNFCGDQLSGPPSTACPGVTHPCTCKSRVHWKSKVTNLPASGKWPIHATFNPLSAQVLILSLKLEQNLSHWLLTKIFLTRY